MLARQGGIEATPCLLLQKFRLLKRSTILSEVAVLAKGSRETTLVGDLSES